jgi:hypothetical protein
MRKPGKDAEFLFESGYKERDALGILLLCLSPGFLIF